MNGIQEIRTQAIVAIRNNTKILFGSMAIMEVFLFLQFVMQMILREQLRYYLIIWLSPYMGYKASILLCLICSLLLSALIFAPISIGLCAIFLNSCREKKSSLTQLFSWFAWGRYQKVIRLTLLSSVIVSALSWVREIFDLPRELGWLFSLCNLLLFILLSLCPFFIADSTKPPVLTMIKNSVTEMKSRIFLYVRLFLPSILLLIALLLIYCIVFSFIFQGFITPTQILDFYNLSIYCQSAFGLTAVITALLSLYLLVLPFAVHIQALAAGFANSCLKK